MAVRKATVNDIPALLEMGRALHAESPRYRDRAFDAEKVAATARMLIGTATTDGAGCLFVAVKQGEVIGVVGGTIVEHWFGPDRYATDYTFYVKPEHRGGFAADRLRAAFEQWAAEQGVDEVIPGTSTMIDSDKTKAFYLRRGYDVHGYAFIKRIR